MSNKVKKVFIQIESTDEQKKNIQNVRKTLKTLQKTATPASDKENLTGRPKDFILKSKIDVIKAKLETNPTTTPQTKSIKRLKRAESSCQTEPIKDKTTNNKTLIDDLITDGEPSENYWKELAETRRIALQETLRENEDLSNKLKEVEQELQISRVMLSETKNLVQVLTEMLDEDNDDKDEKKDNSEDDANDSDASVNENITKVNNKSNSFIDDGVTDESDE